MDQEGEQLPQFVQLRSMRVRHKTQNARQCTHHVGPFLHFFERRFAGEPTLETKNATGCVLTQ